MSKTPISIHPTEQWNGRHVAAGPESRAALWRRCQIYNLNLHQLFRLLRMPSGDIPGRFGGPAGWYLLIKTSRPGTETPHETQEASGKRAASRPAQTLKPCRGGRNARWVPGVWSLGTLRLLYCGHSAFNPWWKWPLQLYYQRPIHLSMMSSAKQKLL